MNRYLTLAVVVLLLMVADQARALKSLSQFAELQKQKMDDYWHEIQHCKR